MSKQYKLLSCTINGKKVEKMIARTGNPYFRRSGNSKIKISFSNNGENLKDNYIAMLVNA